MTQLNVDDIVLLIHGEVATAVTSAQQFGAFDKLSLDTVRVRMGQQTSDESVDGSDKERPIAINSERYPNSENGWLIDVTYSVTEQNQPSASVKPITQEQWLASTATAFFAAQSVLLLEGIAKSRGRQLEIAGVSTIEQLASLRESEHPELFTKLGGSVFRKLRTMARLSLATPPIQVPSLLDPLRLTDLLKDFDNLLLEYGAFPIAEEAKVQLKHWLEQLEFCFDDDFFQSLKFSQLSH